MKLADIRIGAIYEGRSGARRPAFAAPRGPAT